MKRLFIILCLYGSFLISAERRQSDAKPAPRRLGAFMGYAGALTDFTDDNNQPGIGLYADSSQRRLSVSSSASQVIPSIVCTAVVLKDRRASSGSVVELQQATPAPQVTSVSSTDKTLVVPKGRRKSSVSFDFSTSLRSTDEDGVQPFFDLQERLRRGSNFSEASSRRSSMQVALPSVPRLSITGVESDPEKLTKQLEETHEAIAQAQTPQERSLLLDKATKIVSLLTMLMKHLQGERDQLDLLSDELVEQNKVLQTEVVASQKELQAAQEKLRTCSAKRVQELSEKVADLQRTVDEKNARLRVLHRQQGINSDPRVLR